MGTLQGKVAIVGVGGDTQVGVLPGKSSLLLSAEASKMALVDAGLTFSDVDGLLTMNSRIAPSFIHCIDFAEYMTLYPLKYMATLELGGATQAAMVHHAAAAILGGLAEVILCVTGDNLYSGLTGEGAVAQMAQISGHKEFENPSGLLPASFYAFVAQRHMYQYGTTSEQLARVAVAMRRHASLNPSAQKREIISVEDVLNSKMIASPLHMLDCSLISDGAGAVIITSTERAKDLRKDPIYLLGAGESHHQGHVTEAPDLTKLGAREAGETAFRMADVTPSDIDVAELYDCFTITVICELEELGFCEEGEGGPYVEGGNIDLEGPLPTNTHGGLLSHAHPGRPSGMFHIIEGVRQLRHEAGDRQVKGANIAFIHGHGGYVSCNTSLILGREVP